MQRSTFAGFNTAWTAVNASMRWLDVTGQNISNINTTGYTRQIVRQNSLYNNGYDLYSSSSNPAVGNGVIVSGIAQVRNEFLDVRFRNEICKVGEQNTLQSALNDLQNIFDETSVDGLAADIETFIKQLNQLAQNKSSSEFDSMVRSAATSLVQRFNQQANALQDIKKQQLYQFKDVEVSGLNNTIKQIVTLNETIRNNQVHGNNSLELLDQRNMLLDEVSTYLNASVTVSKEEVSPGSGVFVDKIKVTTRDADGNEHTLIDDDKGSEFRVEDPGTGNNQTTKLFFKPEGGAEVDLTNKIASGSLKGYQDILNKGGEFEGDATRGIKYYEKMLDSLANKFATIFNDQNKAGWDADGVKGKDLFTSSDTTTTPTPPITAATITIAPGWASGSYGIAGSATPPADWIGDNSGDNDNVLKMIDLFKKKDLTYADISNPTGTTVFTGTLQEAFSGMSNTLALDVKSAEGLYKNYSSVVNGISDLRDGISGVSLDEEGMNLMHYQRSLTAASRLMNTLDEALQTIINMGVVGR